MVGVRVARRRALNNSLADAGRRPRPDDHQDTDDHPQQIDDASRHRPVHKVSEGKVCLWKDYWEFNAIANATWFQSSLEGADLSWVFDASGLI